MARAPADRVFFLRSGIVLILFIAAGFGGRALTQREETPPPAWILLPHIVCIGGWYLLFVVQAALIGSRRLRLHRRLGYASVPLVVALLWTGVVVMAANFRLKGDAPLVFFNVLNLSQFAVLYTFAILNVRRPATHKRLLLFGSIAMMPPALVRLIQAVGLPEVATVGLIVGLLVPPILHDRRTLTRGACCWGLHRATWAGLIAIGAGLVIGGPIAFSDGWESLVRSTIGPPHAALGPHD